MGKVEPLRPDQARKVHPVADLFPMMSDDELAELADDIKAHGLINPIIIDSDGLVLIDGRNRLRACEIAGVEPRFEHFHGNDPVSLILSLNVARRHLTKGQQAMAVAMAYPEGKRGRYAGKDVGSKYAETADLSYRRLAEAELTWGNCVKETGVWADFELAGVA